MATGTLAVPFRPDAKQPALRVDVTLTWRFGSRSKRRASRLANPRARVRDHLATGAGAEERLDVELAAERVPQLLTAAVLDPREQLVSGEAKGQRREEMERRRLLFEITFVASSRLRDEQGQEESRAARSSPLTLGVSVT